MKAEVQTDFSGGMCDRGRGRPADSYVLAENCDWDVSGCLTRRPLARFEEEKGVETLHVAVIDTHQFGLLYFRIYREASQQSVPPPPEPSIPKIYLRAMMADASGDLSDYLWTRLQMTGISITSPPPVDCIEEDEEPGARGVCLFASSVQVGDTFYVFLKFTNEFYVFSGQFRNYFKAVGGGGVKGMYLFRQSDGLPACRAACYAFGRVWLATRLGDTGDQYFQVTVTDRVDADADWPGLKVTAPTISVDDGTASDVLGFCPVGSAMLVFKRFSVWRIEGCDGESGGLRISMLTRRAGAAGPGAFLAAGGVCHYVNGEGLWRVGERGEPECLSAGIAGWWRENVVIGNEIYPDVTVCEHGGLLLVSVPYLGDVLPVMALLAYDPARKRFLGVWTGEGFGGILAGSTERGSRSAYCFGRGGRAQILPRGVWFDDLTPYDGIGMRVVTRDAAPGPGRHFVGGLRLRLRNSPDGDGEDQPATATATLGAASVEREVPPGDSAVSFHFACTSPEVVFDVTVAGGMVAIEAATSTFVPR